MSTSSNRSRRRSASTSPHDPRGIGFQPVGVQATTDPDPSDIVQNSLKTTSTDRCVLPAIQVGCDPEARDGFSGSASTYLPIYLSAYLEQSMKTRIGICVVATCLVALVFGQVASVAQSRSTISSISPQEQERLFGSDPSSCPSCTGSTPCIICAAPSRCTINTTGGCDCANNGSPGCSGGTPFPGVRNICANLACPGVGPACPPGTLVPNCGTSQLNMPAMPAPDRSCPNVGTCTNFLGIATCDGCK